eukprot:3900523-Alexandrium_andersonii.AAC.1
MLGPAGSTLVEVRVEAVGSNRQVVFWRGGGVCVVSGRARAMSTRKFTTDLAGRVRFRSVFSGERFMLPGSAIRTSRCLTTGMRIS